MVTYLNLGNMQLESVQIGQGNNQFNSDKHQHLKASLQQVLNDAQADDVDKQQYAAINQAVEMINAEIKKGQGADQSMFARAKKILEPLKNISSIASSVSKILPFL